MNGLKIVCQSREPDEEKGKKDRALSDMFLALGPEGARGNGTVS